MNKDKKQDQLGQRLRTISADLKLYFEKRLELVMLNTGEYVSGWMAASILKVAGALLLLVGVCFLLVALAIYLGSLLGSESLGYVVVSLPMLIAGLLFIYLKPKGVFKQLQQHFEAEVIEAIEQNGKIEQKKIESVEENRSPNSEE
jgi:hypothetical protein